MRLFVQFTLILIATTATAVDIQCFFNSEDYPSYGFAYSCSVVNGIIRRKSDVEVKSMNGSHLQTNRTDADVIGFLIFYKVSKHFPKNVTKFFPNIEVISVEYSRLTAIHKEDLRQFGHKLIDIGLEGNEISSIERDLFEFNPNIQFISLISNKIKTVSEHVFDKLNVLNGINLIDNDCISYIYYGREIRDFIRSIQLKCHEKFSSKNIQIPVLVNEVEYNAVLVKLYKKKVMELEEKVRELESEKKVSKRDEIWM